MNHLRNSQRTTILCHGIIPCLRIWMILRQQRQLVSIVKAHVNNSKSKQLLPCLINDDNHVCTLYVQLLYSDMIANVFTENLISETTLQVKFMSLMTNTVLQ